jgi:hypothetical protein
LFWISTTTTTTTTTTATEILQVPEPGHVVALWHRT